MFYCGQCAEYRDAQKLHVFGVSPPVRGHDIAVLQVTFASYYILCICTSERLHTW